MLMSDGPWSPEHIYQEIVGYGKTWHRGKHFKVCNCKGQTFKLLVSDSAKVRDKILPLKAFIFCSVVVFVFLFRGPQEPMNHGSKC